jgi:multisubunit Na+/H+ antiporter MnhF subunit
MRRVTMTAFFHEVAALIALVSFVATVGVWSEVVRVLL